MAGSCIIWESWLYIGVLGGGAGIIKLSIKQNGQMTLLMVT